MRPLILGSSSPYRRELLERLHLDFEVDSPDIDETPRAGEIAPDYVKRLAHEKAEEVGARHSDALVISSDQCAELNGQLLGKPGTHDVAVEQLRRLSGQEAAFLTGLCLLDTASGTCRYFESRHTVYYKELSGDMIEHYLQSEQPYNCTASFKSEGLGITLVDHISGDDPTALIGLPMIHLIELLRDAGLEIPGAD
ncbi:MAG: Maf family protein [Gammaproteobacteria bacterium]|nr:Maf family protein [Gammaproteobacteria bacterium]